MKRIIYIAIAFALSFSAEAQTDRSVQPKPGPAPTINLGKPQSFDLPNGMKVLVVENHKLPRVTFSLALDNPPSVEGNIKGVADLASSMMGNGTSKISKDDYNAKIDYYGASVSFSVDGVSGNTLSRYFPEVLSLVAQGALDPLLTQDDLDAERAKLLDALKTEEKSTQSIASNVRSTLIYGKNHPKGEYLSESTINNVTLANVKDYYKKYFVPGKAYLVVVGDVTFEEVKKQVTKDFSGWKKDFAPTSTYSEPVNLTETEIDFVDVASAVQSEISVNNVVTLKMTDPDYFAALLANYILGGGAESRLFLNLREAHGWTYGSYSSISGDKYTTSFSAYAAVRNVVTDSAVVELKKELAHIRAMKPTQSELDLAKAAYLGSFVMNAEKPQTVAGFALREETQNLPVDFYQNYIKNLEAVTLDDVQAAAKKYILNDGTRIIVVGKASDVLPGLEKLGIPIKFFDRFGNPTNKPEIEVVKSDVTVESILQKYIDAIGGAENVEKVKSLEYVAKGEIQGQEISLKRVESSDGRALQLISAMGMDFYRLALNKDKGYLELQGERKELSEDQIITLKKKLLFPELRLIKSPDSMTLSGIETVDGKKVYKLVDGHNYFYYDVQSGLKVGEGSITEVAPGQEVNEGVSLSDYRTINGVKVPYKITLNIGVDVALEISDIKINQGLSSDLFN